ALGAVFAAIMKQPARAECFSEVRVLGGPGAIAWSTRSSWCAGKTQAFSPLFQPGASARWVPRYRRWDLGPGDHNRRKTSDPTGVVWITRTGSSVVGRAGGQTQ